MIAREHSPTDRGPLWPCLVPAGVFALAAWGLIVSGNTRGRGAHDQVNFHLPAILRFAEEWPRLDYSDYLSATTPGYHTLLAAFARFVSDSPRALQFVGSLFTVALLVALGLACRRAGRAALLLVMPAAASMYVFFSGVWLLPDNAGWLGVLAALLLALRGRVDAPTIVGGGVLLAGLVFVRQSHLWAAAALWAGAWLGVRDAQDGEPFDAMGDARALLRDPALRVARTALAVAATVPAALVVLYFHRLWGGLTPPTFQERHTGGNAAAPAFILSLFGAFSLFYAGFLAPAAAEAVRKQRLLLALAIVGGLAAALLPETTYSTEAGRYSGLWNLVQKAPVVMGGRTSTLIVLLAPLGACAVLAWFVALPRRERWIMLVSVVAFTAAQMASYKLWQRYTEPLLLLLLPVLACRLRRAAVGPRGVMAALWHLRLVGPASLALTLAFATAITVAAASPVRRIDPHTIKGVNGDTAEDGPDVSGVVEQR